MTKTWKAAVVAFASVLLMAAMAVAQMGEHGHMRGDMGMGGPGFGHGFGGRIAKALNLTDAQKQQIKTMFQSERPTVQPLFEALANSRKALEAATAGGKFDEAQVRTLANQQAQTMAQLIVEREKVKSQIYNTVLTPEQRTKADQLMADWANRREQMQQRWKDKSAPQKQQQ